MKRTILLAILIIQVFMIHAQENIALVENKYQKFFNEAYSSYPSIPHGILEAVAWTNTRFAHIDESFAPSCTGMPKAWGVMGLTEDGKNYFRENLKLVSQLSGISIDEIKHNPEKNILAYASAFDKIASQRGIKSSSPADYKDVLTDLSELPIDDKNMANDFAMNSFLYSVYSFLNNEDYAKAYNFQVYNLDLRKIFGENLDILSSKHVYIGDDGVFSDNGQAYSPDPKTACPDYSVDSCFWVAADPSNYSSRNGTAISAVVIHDIEGSYSSAISWFQNPNANVSAHYVLRSSDGQITQMVHEADKAWHVGSENPYTVGLEHEGYAGQDGWYTVPMYQSSAGIVRHLISAYGINPYRTFFRDTLDDGTALDYGSHVLAGSSYCTKIAGHQHYPNQTHTDPGPNWNWNYYYRLINEGNGNVHNFTASTGTFTDTGGESGDYSNDEREIYVIQPTGSDRVRLNFSAFDLETNYDFMYIYDGDNVFAPLIGRYNTQSPGTVVSSGNAITVEFRSDCATTASGWVASWEGLQDDNTPPTTTVSTTGGQWKTTDFTANFTDQDSSGIQYRFYQVIEFDGNDWFANSQNGFFADNFMSSDYTDQWISVSGIWSIDSEQLHQSDEDVSNSNIYASCNQNGEDQYLYHFVAKIDGSGTNRRFGFHFMCDDGSATNRGNSYFVWFRVDDQALQFYSVQNDSFTLEENIDNITTTPGVLYDFKIIYDKTTGKTLVYRDDQLLGSHTFSNPLTNGDYISFRTGNCQMYVDHIKVYKSRSTSATVTVGADNSNDISVQSPDQSTYIAKVKSIVVDDFDNISQVGYEELYVDFTQPSLVAVNDGTGADIDETSDNTQLSANWTPSYDENSGIARYWYSIGTTVGGTDVVDWTDNGTDTSVTVTGLNLEYNTTYYFNVKAENGAGLMSDVASSDGVVLQGSIFAGFEADNTVICENDQVNFTNTSQNANSYLWTFEGGTPATSTDENPVVTYSNAGTYDVKLVAYAGGDSAVYELTDYITVYASPVADFQTTDTLIYLPNAIASFTNLSENADSYLWNFGDGTTSTTEEPSHLYTTTGTYTVSLTASNEGCPDNTKTITDLVKVLDATAIDNLNNSVSVMPNPFDNKLFITSKDKIDNLFLYNSAGKLIKVQYTTNGNSYEVKLPDGLQQGLYLLKINTNGQTAIFRLIKK